MIVSFSKKNDRFSKRPTRFELLENKFTKNDLRPFFIRLFFKKTIVFQKKGLTIILTIVNETTNFIRTVVFGNKLHATLLNVVLHVVKHFLGS